MNKEKDFLPNRQALQFKELGFNEPCIAIHSFVDGELNFMYVNNFHSNNDVNELSAAAPTYEQAFRWLRDTHDLHHEIIKENGINISTNIFFIPTTQIGLKRKVTHIPQCIYEQAQLTCIIKLIEILKNKTNKMELTYGQKAVGITFNPSNDDKVGMCKQKYAELIDDMNNLRSETTSQEVKRMCSIAITELQAAQMWSVKSITWKD
ncbi:MAG: DUF7681 family protein [Candidatus Kapaibacteriota bacterium]